eukprot:UN06160
MQSKKLKLIRQPCQIIHPTNKNVFAQQTNINKVFSLPDSPYYNYRRVQMQHNNLRALSDTVRNNVRRF